MGTHFRNVSTTFRMYRETVRDWARRSIDYELRLWFGKCSLTFCIKFVCNYESLTKITILSEFKNGLTDFATKDIRFSLWVLVVNFKNS